MLIWIIIIWIHFNIIFGNLFMFQYTFCNNWVSVLLSRYVKKSESSFWSTSSVIDYYIYPIINTITHQVLGEKNRDQVCAERVLNMILISQQCSEQAVTVLCVSSILGDSNLVPAKLVAMIHCSVYFYSKMSGKRH